MTHLDEGALVALRDGAVVREDARLHIDACATCRAALDEVRRRADKVAEALTTNAAHVDVQTAKAAVRARLDALRDRERPRTNPTRHLRRAAAILLVTAGAAWALPGSPVRDWLRTDSAPVSSAEVDPAVQEVAVQEAVEASGIEVDVRTDIEVALLGVGVGTEIEVVWLAEPIARLSAGAGSSYSFAEGRIEATLAPGPVRLALPRAATMVSVAVNGRMVLQGRSDRLELTVDVVEQTADRVLISTTNR